MRGIIDFHAHAFPDKVAADAIPYLEEEGDVKAIHDGRVASLLNLMDRDGVEKSVICSIATKPSHLWGLGTGSLGAAFSRFPTSSIRQKRLSKLVVTSRS